MKTIEMGGLRELQALSTTMDAIAATSDDGMILVAASDMEDATDRYLSEVYGRTVGL